MIDMKRFLSTLAVLLLMAVSAKAQTQPIDVVCTSASAQPVPPSATSHGAYILDLQNAEYQFTFWILLYPGGDADIVDGQTYTLDDMLDDECGLNKTTSEVIKCASVALVRNVDSYVVDVTDTLGQQYHITYSPAAPITEPKDTVFVTMSNVNNQNIVYDRIASQGNIYLYGCSDDGRYRINVQFASDTFAGTYTFADRCTNDMYFMLVEYTPNGERTIPCNNLFDVTVTGTEASCTAHIEWVSGDSTMYDISFSYADPIAETFRTFTATDLTITKGPNYEAYAAQGIYSYRFNAYDNNIRLYGMIYNSNADNPLGTWNFDRGTTLALTLSDTVAIEMMSATFSGTITVTQDENGLYSLTGTTLMYDHTQWTFNCTQADTADVAISEVEAAKFVVTGEHNAVVIRAAEGRDVMISDLTGRIIMSGKISSDVERINVPESGIYIARIGNRAVKVYVK